MRRVEAFQTETSLAAYVMAYIEYTGTFPAEGLQLLVDKPRKSPIPDRWKMLLEELPKDPWGGDFVLVIDKSSKKDEVVLTITSLGADQKTGGDDIYVCPGRNPKSEIKDYQ